MGTYKDGAHEGPRSCHDTYVGVLAHPSRTKDVAAWAMPTRRKAEPLSITNSEERKGNTLDCTRPLNQAYTNHYTSHPVYTSIDSTRHIVAGPHILKASLDVRYWGRRMGFAAIVHYELRRLPAPDVLSDGGERHVQRKDHVVTEDLVLLVGPGSVVSASRGERTAIE